MPSFNYDFDAFNDRSDREYRDARQSLDDAFAAGQRAGKLGLGAGLNDYEPGSPEHAEWMRAYQQALARYMDDRPEFKQHVAEAMGGKA